MRIQLCAILASSLLLTACGGVGSGANGTTQADQAVQQANDQMAQIRAQAVRAQASLANAQKALSVLTNPDGSFKFSVLLGVNVSDLGTCVSSQFQPGTMLFLPADIANAMKCVLDDVVTAVKTVKDDVGASKASLNAALAALPATATQEAAAIQALLVQIDQIQATYVTMVTTLASQITLATQFLNTLPALATGVCPIPVPGLNMVCGAAVSIFLQPLITEIATFQAQLLSI